MMTMCYFCKGKVVEKKIRHVHHWGNELIIFDDVPAEVCQQCGEVYFSPEVLERMDNAVLAAIKPKRVVCIPVFSLPEAATA